MKKSEKCYKSSIRQNCFGWSYHLNDENIDKIFKQVDSFYYRNERFTSMVTKIDVKKFLRVLQKVTIGYQNKKRVLMYSHFSDSN